MEERLSKIIAQAGIMSRREADRAVRAGRVSVNGALVTEPGFHVNPADSHIKVDGRLLRLPDTLTYIVVNKPRGVSSSVRDPQGRPTVVTMMPGRRGRLLPIMPLERDDEGVVILTSDSAMAAALSRIDTGIERIHLLKVRGTPSEHVLERMRTGVPLMRGRSRPMNVRILSSTGRNSWLEVVTREGRSRLLHHMMLKLNHPLMKLKRISFGPVSVEGLPPGAWRELRLEEVKVLRDLASHPPGLPERMKLADKEEQNEGSQATRPYRAMLPSGKRSRRLGRNQVAKSRGRNKRGLARRHERGRKPA